MKKLILVAATLFAVAACAEKQEAAAEGYTWPVPSVTLGGERSLEAETNTLYSAFGLGNMSFGVVWKDTASATGEFNLDKFEFDVTQDVGPLSVYVKNDFDDSLKHSETVVGGKIKF